MTSSPIQIVLVNRIIVLSFGNKSTSSRIPTEQATFWSTYTVLNRRFPVCKKYGLRAAGCGLWEHEQASVSTAFSSSPKLS